MKKTISIHIGGYIFNIEEDAYAILEEWLKRLSIQYSDEEGGDEIINDIEIRVAEIFQQEIGIDNSVVTDKEVQKVIEIMGKPEEFEEEIEEETEKKSTKAPSYKKPWKKRRLYRDEDNNILGGVCSGIANYFGVDPMIIRLLLIATIIFGGFGTIIYIILWIIVPKAETTAQKLEMKGEPVNVSNIEKAIKEEFENVKNTIINSTRSENLNKLKTGLNEVVETIVNIIVKIFKGISGLLGVSLIVAGVLASLIAFGFIFNSSASDILFFNIGVFEWRPFIGLLPSQISSPLASIGLFLLIAIPLIMIVLIGTRILFKHKSTGKVVRFGGISLWIVGLIITSLIGVRIAKNYQSENSLVNMNKISDSTISTLYLSLNDNYNSKFDKPDYVMSNYNIINTKENMKLYGKPLLNIKKSTEGETNIKLSYYANGKSKKDAYIRAQKISYNWLEKDSLISFYPYFTVKGDNKLFKRKLYITLEIPEGKSVYIDSSMINLIHDIENTENLWDHEMIGKKWIMTDKGLSLFKNKEIKIEEDEKEKTDSIKVEQDTIDVSNKISI